MNMESLQLGLAQFATLVFSTATLISQPQLAAVVLLIVGLTFSFSLGCCAAIGFLCLKHGLNISVTNYGALLGTHLGGLICYIVTFAQAAAYVFAVANQSQ
jgi:hypothetical protein